MPGTSPGKTVFGVAEERKRPGGGALTAFELRDEEDLAALADLLEIAGLVVDLAVDRDGGLLFKVLAKPRIELVERLDHVAQALRLDRKSTRLNSSHRCISYA